MIIAGESYTVRSEDIFILLPYLDIYNFMPIILAERARY